MTTYYGDDHHAEINGEELGAMMAIGIAHAPAPFMTGLLRGLFEQIDEAPDVKALLGDFELLACFLSEDTEAALAKLH